MFMSKKVSAVVAAGVLAAAVALGGCASSASSSAASASSESAASSEASASASSASASASSSAASSSAAAADEVLVVGEKTDSSVDITFTNQMPAAITNIAMLPAGSADAPAFLMVEGEQVEPGKKVQVFTPAIEGLYDAVIQCGEATYAVHDMNLSLFNEATVLLEGDVAYLNVEIEGNAVSSLQEEMARVQTASEAEAISAEEEMYAEEYVDDAVSYDEAYDETYVEEDYYDDSADYAEDVYYDAPQDEDTCVDDIVLN